MTRLILLLGIWALSATSQAASPAACKALTSDDAAALAGAPLPENFKNESPPTVENGHDTTSVCGWFPRGYNLATAGGPPERGVQISIHTFRTPAEARTFHKFGIEMAHESAKTGPSTGKLAPIAGLGDAAFVGQKQFSGVNVATARFLKGASAVQVQAWAKGKSAAEMATTAAKQAAAKL